jgi:hypothetical protein
LHRSDAYGIAARAATLKQNQEEYLTNENATATATVKNKVVQTSQ